jgi:YD repeat-containing protein
MGWDGESRRVWVQDGAGRREYTYTEWGQVARQRGCCGSADGIEVVAVSAIYDEAGRKTSEREERADGSAVRTIRYTYDKLGRLETIGDDRGAVVYHYEAGTGRLQREDYPNGSYVAYTYYGADNPSQVGFVWKVEHKRSADKSLLIGYEYTYDLLGRVVQSVEYPSGDKTELLCCNDTPADYRHPPRKVNAHTKRTQQQKNCGASCTPHPSPTPHDAPNATPDYAHHPQTCA